MDAYAGYCIYRFFGHENKFVDNFQEKAVII